MCREISIPCAIVDTCTMIYSERVDIMGNKDTLPILNIFSWEAIVDSWNMNRDYSRWESILIGLFCLVTFGGLSILMVYVREECVIEYGYPKKKNKQVRKKFSQYSIFDRLFLLRLIMEADRLGIYLLLTLVCHWVHLLSLPLTVVGFLGLLISPGSGWAITLSFHASLAVLMFSCGIEIIPNIICLPSERKRWRGW